MNNNEIKKSVAELIIKLKNECFSLEMFKSEFSDIGIHGTNEYGELDCEFFRFFDLIVSYANSEGFTVARDKAEYWSEFHNQAINEKFTAIFPSKSYENIALFELKDIGELEYPTLFKIV